MSTGPISLGRNKSVECLPPKTPVKTEEQTINLLCFLIGSDESDKSEVFVETEVRRLGPRTLEL